MKLMIFALIALLVGGCAKESSKKTDSTPESPQSTPVNPDEIPNVRGGLVGSIWTGDSQSGDGVLNYVFQFHRDVLSIESTCHVAQKSSTVKSDLAVIYFEDGNAVDLKSGLQLKIPAGRGFCSVNFPAGLKFYLDHDQIFIEYDGTRRSTQMKRQN